MSGSFFKIGFLVAMCLHCTLRTSAQDTYYQDEIIPEKSYWRLFTDYSSRSTVVKFYNSSHQLVYEEVIRGKYIRLTSKNVRLLNQTLNLLTENQLIASTVKSTELETANRQSVLNIPTELLRDELKSSRDAKNLPASGFRINSDMLISSNKLNIIFENPNQNFFRIMLLDEAGKEIYRERTSLAGYNRSLNFEGMQPGAYTLKIEGKNIHFYRKVIFSYKDNTPYLQAHTKNTP